MRDATISKSMIHANFNRGSQSDQKAVKEEFKISFKNLFLSISNME